MLILSAVMIYIVSFAGVKSGKLKNDISWTRPIFVALFNDDVNDGCTEKANTPVEVVIKDGKLDIGLRKTSAVVLRKLRW